MTISKQLFSHISSNGLLEISLQKVDVPKPDKGQIIVKILAAPINPSDMRPMFGLADMEQLQLSDDGTHLKAPVPQYLLQNLRSRLDQVLPVGNEGAGEVIATGEGAEALMGKIVGLVSGACYAEYICVPMKACLPMNEGISAEQAASSFVNPLTALCMIETMKQEGHKAIIHTAAASNLGQMLNRICLADNVPLINIVRKQEQVDLLKNQGAKFIVNSSSKTFKDDLYDAVAQTNATLAFDAIGGGTLANEILTAMEANLSSEAKGHNTYGSLELKQVYTYGTLSQEPVELQRGYGQSWSIGGWLLNIALNKLSEEKMIALRKRIANEITTTFASSYTQKLSLEEVLSPKIIAEYYAKRTGEKYLITPQK